MRLQKSLVSAAYPGHRIAEDDREFLAFCESFTVSKEVLTALVGVPDMASIPDAEAYLKKGKQNVSLDTAAPTGRPGLRRRLRRGRDAA